MSKTEGAFGLVLNNKNELLLVQLPERFKPFPKYWNFPGGTMLAGEDPEVAVIREVLEETGITCKPVKKLDRDEDENITLYLYLCESVSGGIKPQPKEVIKADWFSKNQALRLPLAFNVKQKIEQYL